MPKTASTYAERLAWGSGIDTFGEARLRQAAGGSKGVDNWKRRGIPSHQVVKLLNEKAAPPLPSPEAALDGGARELGMQEQWRLLSKIRGHYKSNSPEWRLVTLFLEKVAIGIPDDKAAQPEPDAEAEAKPVRRRA